MNDEDKLDLDNALNKYKCCRCRKKGGKVIVHFYPKLGTSITFLGKSLKTVTTKWAGCKHCGCCWMTLRCFIREEVEEKKDS